MSFFKRVNYTKTFSILFALVGITLSILILGALFIQLNSFQNKSDLDKATYELESKVKYINEFYHHYKTFLYTLEDNKFLHDFLQTNNLTNKENLTTLFKTLLEHDQSITQLRYLEFTGKEIIRVDRKKTHSNVQVILENKLQNKKHRDYFQQTMKKSKGEIYISKLDLNIEFKKLEIPYKPVWRFAIPIFYKNKKVGMVIVNIFGKFLVDNLIDSKNFYIDVLDQDNQLLVSNNKTKQEWTRYIPENISVIENSYILQDVLFENENQETLFLSITSKDNVGDFFRLINYQIIYLILFIVVLSFIFGKLLANIPKKLFDKLEKQQKILLQQSKLAAMGEMTAMLAHQWRQPINAISVLVQEAQIKYSAKLLTDEDFQSISSKINEKVSYMSDTINDFRDFYKPQKEKQNFDVIDAIKAAIHITQMRLDSKFIKANIIYDKNQQENKSFFVYTFKGQLEQVFVNLINNSIDAVIENTNSSDTRHIQITIKSDNNKITIEFEDTGKGIAENILPTIFEPYISTKTEQNGSGLGLYMSKMIIEKNMQGTLEASNKQNGACFTIR